MRFKYFQTLFIGNSLNCSMEQFLMGTLLHLHVTATLVHFCYHAVCQHKAVHQYTCDCLDICCRYY